MAFPLQEAVHGQQPERTVKIEPSVFEHRWQGGTEACTTLEGHQWCVVYGYE